MTNAFSNLDKYTLQFGKIHFTFWTNTNTNTDQPTKLSLHCPRACIQSSAEPEQCQQHDDDYYVDNAGDYGDGHRKDVI